MRVLAVNVRGQSIFAAIYWEGQLSEYHETTWNNTRGFSALLETLKTVLLTYTDYVCIGICTTEMACKVDSNLTIGPRNVLGKEKFPLCSLVEEIAKVPVFMEHRSNAFAMGEAVHGAGRAWKNLLCVNYSSQVVGGIIVNGQLYTGSNRLAGNIGHMSLYATGLTCECGRQGCYERYASTKELVHRANTADPSIQNGIDLMNEVNKGNIVITYILESWIADVVRGLINVIYVLDPEGLVLGGGIFKEELIFRRVKQELFALLPQRRLHVAQAELGGQAVIKGISVLAIEHYNQRKVNQ